MLSGRSTPTILDPESASLLDASGAVNRSYGSSESAAAASSAGATGGGKGLPARMEREASAARREDRKRRRRDQWRSLRRRASYYMPVLEWLPSYRLPQLAGDVVAALTVRQCFPNCLHAFVPNLVLISCVPSSLRCSFRSRSAIRLCQASAACMASLLQLFPRWSTLYLAHAGNSRWDLRRRCRSSSERPSALSLPTKNTLTVRYRQYAS